MRLLLCQKEFYVSEGRTIVAVSGRLAPLSTRLSTRPTFLKSCSDAKCGSQNVVFLCFLWVSPSSPIRFRRCPRSGGEFFWSNFTSVVCRQCVVIEHS